MKILLKLKTNLHFFLIFTLKLVSWEYKFNLTLSSIDLVLNI